MKTSACRGWTVTSGVQVQPRPSSETGQFVSCQLNDPSEARGARVPPCLAAATIWSKFTGNRPGDSLRLAYGTRDGKDQVPRLSCGPSRPTGATSLPECALPPPSVS